MSRPNEFAKQQKDPSMIPTLKIPASLLLLCICLPVRPCMAFNEGGHHTIAVLAFRELPEARQRELIQILREHPTFMRDFALPASVRNETEWLIGRAGYWPDIARAFDEWNRPSWHYQLGPTGVIGDPDVPEDPVQLPEGADLDLQELHVVQAITLCRGVLGAAESSESDRALAICWLCHLVADLHLPVHAGSLYVEGVFDEGDRGANSIVLRENRNLHALWDDTLGRKFDEGDVNRRARIIAKEHIPKVRTQLLSPRNLDPLHWVMNGRQVALTHVYTEEIMRPIREFAARGSTDGVAFPTLSLSKDYFRNAGQVARDRAALAALRLAKILE